MYFFFSLPLYLGSVVRRGSAPATTPKQSVYLGGGGAVWRQQYITTHSKVIDEVKSKQLPLFFCPGVANAASLYKSTVIVGPAPPSLS
ncbi:hypothetical protein E2C01_071657 [Portunus trituberculatus]|uniref:Uncharacterized protein n=1 Tax=Portunus trituberculatus TaxID=210409 RepID=A0A5B7I5P2_PORTR|nr:hypothetical protein [Portunus trituberculatus]